MFRDTLKSQEEVRECECACRDGTSFDGLDESEGARMRVPGARDGAEEVLASGSLVDWVKPA